VELEDGIVVFGLGGLPREGILDAEFTIQDGAMENHPTGAGSALAVVGHGGFSVTTFAEIAMNWHTIHLGFRIAAANLGNGRLLEYLFCF
jgi:hypothetical protein